MTTNTARLPKAGAVCEQGEALLHAHWRRLLKIGFYAALAMIASGLVRVLAGLIWEPLEYLLWPADYIVTLWASKAILMAFYHTAIGRPWNEDLLWAWDRRIAEYFVVNLAQGAVFLACLIPAGFVLLGGVLAKLSGLTLGLLGVVTVIPGVLAGLWFTARLMPATYLAVDGKANALGTAWKATVGTVEATLLFYLRALAAPLGIGLLAGLLAAVLSRQSILLTVVVVLAAVPVVFYYLFVLALAAALWAEALIQGAPAKAAPDAPAAAPQAAPAEAPAKRAAAKTRPKATAKAQVKTKAKPKAKPKAAVKKKPAKKKAR